MQYLRADRVVVHLAVATAAALGAAVSGLDSALWVSGAVAAAAVIMLGFRFPRASLCVAAVLPLLAYGLTPLLTMPLSAALATGAIAGRWSAATSAGRRAAALVLFLGGATLVFGVALAPTEAGLGGTRTAVLHATLVGIGAAMVRLTERQVALVTGTTGLAGAAALLTTPEISLDRTVAVLGQNANGLGFLSAVGLVALMGLVRGGARWWTALLVGLILVLAMGVLASASRGAVVAASAGVVVLVLPRWARSTAPRALVALSLATLFLAVLSRPALALFIHVTGRPVVGEAGSLDTRQSLMTFALERALDNPLTGVGLGNIGTVSLSSAENRIGQRSHNVFVGIFAEAGVFALTALLLLCGLALYQSRRHSPLVGLPLAITVSVGGLALEWWGASGTGLVAVFVLAWAAGGCGRAHEAAPPDPSSPTRRLPQRRRRRALLTP